MTASIRILTALLVALPAMAGVLTFPNNICVTNADGSGSTGSCGNYGFISQAYGDAVDVNITYVDVVNPGQTLRWWDADYNSLRGVAWGGNSDADGQSYNRIEIAPLGGNQVTLNSFELGAYPNTQRTTHVRVVELITNRFLASSSGPVGGSPPLNFPTSFSFGVGSSSNGFAIEWWDSAFNVGIDNIDFTVAPASGVPEPSTFGLLFAGLSLAGALRFRRARG